MSRRANGGQGGARPVRTAAVAIYATLALLILTILRACRTGCATWSRNPVQEVLLQAANGVQAAAQEAVGFGVPYRRVRAAFHSDQPQAASEPTVGILPTLVGAYLRVSGSAPARRP
jgi:hypothetical protein